MTNRRSLAVDRREIKHNEFNEKLTEDRYCEIERSCGSRDRLIGTLQQRYGIEKEQAAAWIEEWADALTGDDVVERR
ncbi:hypothetical protein HDIA_1160 [Hartmannibacter diazotrophicus]|uniref:Uncharacterized protein n=1 Tax=Hartmannibacter diazotrophicus TaxID=1482074 RepID=A0A2C9D4K1_9HYPH|nr:hypothetical protein [Hartmannibacter diazotrophicus]SON54701.1 hypothetical protein HDIA_1160 [Hartmannibacter diazotrophicus]